MKYHYLTKLKGKGIKRIGKYFRRENETMMLKLEESITETEEKWCETYGNPSTKRVKNEDTTYEIAPEFIDLMKQKNFDNDMLASDNDLSVCDDDERDNNNDNNKRDDNNEDNKRDDNDNNNRDNNKDDDIRDIEDEKEADKLLSFVEQTLDDNLFPLKFITQMIREDGAKPVS